MWGHIASGTVIAVAAPSAQALSPRDSLVQVFTYNPTIAIERARSDEAAILVDIAKADRRFDFRFQSKAEQATERQGPVDQNDFTISSTLRATISLTTGGYTSASIAARRAGAAAAEADFEQRQNSVLGQAVDAHLSVARDRTLLRLQQDQTEVLQQLLVSSSARAKLGDLTRTDVDQARARLAGSEARSAQAQAALEISSQEYWRLTGKIPESDLTLDDDLDVVPDARALAALVQQSPAIRAASFRIDEAAAQVRSARSLRYPSVSFFAQVTHRAVGSVLFRPSDRTQVLAGLSLKLPLYQGGAVGARVRAALADQSRLIEQRTDTERSLIAEIRALYAQLQAEEGAVGLGRVAAAAAQEAKTVIIAQNAVGERSFLDILNAQQELLDAQRRLVQARADRVSVAYRIMALFGRLDDVAHAWQARGMNSTRLRAEPSLALSGISFEQRLQGWDLRHMTRS